MKKLLSLLVIFVFLNVSSWAYAPNYGGSAGNIAAQGTYAGVLIPSIVPTTSTTGTTTPTTASTSSASIGVFAVGIPGSSSSTVIAQGAGILFVSGAAYITTITGVFDPSSNQLTAILEGVSDFTVTIPGAPGALPFQTNILAEGQMTAILSAPTQKAFSNGPTAGTAAADRLNGTASVDLYTTVDANGPVITQTATFTVDGFQQTSTYSVPTITPTSTTGS